MRHAKCETKINQLGKVVPTERYKGAKIPFWHSVARVCVLLYRCAGTDARLEGGAVQGWNVVRYRLYPV
jgi:hypothetical protein